MKKKELYKLVKKTLKEYTGTGAGGGNAGDGNNVTSRRPFNTDQDQRNFYRDKNVYGAEGGQRVGDKAIHPSYNRDRRGGMFEQGSDDYGDATLTTQGQSIHRAPGVWEEDEGVLTEEDMEDIQKGLARAMMGHQLKGVDIKRLYARKKYAAQRADLEKPRAELNKAEREEMMAFNKEKSQIRQGGGGATGGGEEGAVAEQLIKEYFKDTQSNLMDRMDFYRKKAKRSILMEGAMQQFFEKFEGGMTDEEIIQDYASQGTQVPEQFVGTARKTYEGYKKLKLELEMSEKEFKNSAKEIVNNPDDMVMEDDPDAKQLASGLFKEAVLKKQIKKELTKIKNK